ncbi:rCG47224 [Rattus norvegicus]|uniref:RCG47224 n=1 Tax=Rattus norvegicus TaxID=10116 RepID=A6HY88_RAT|nr:rCG47224 [Rattus norvegicus]
MTLPLVLETKGHQQMKTRLQSVVSVHPGSKALSSVSRGFLDSPSHAQM